MDDTLFYPKNPKNGYISKYPVTFCGCLGYWVTTHIFKSCPSREDKAMRFMQDFLLKFDIYHLVVIDDITLFRMVSIAACDTLHLKYKYVSKRNHNAFLVEKFHRFLNKTIYITISDIKTLGCFIESGIVTGCALNSTPIDGRSIIHNSLAIGRALKFHIDIYIYIYIWTRCPS